METIHFILTGVIALMVLNKKSLFYFDMHSTNNFMYITFKCRKDIRFIYVLKEEQIVRLQLFKNKEDKGKYTHRLSFYLYKGDWNSKKKKYNPTIYKRKVFFKILGY